MATYASIFAWKIPVDRGAWWATVHGFTKSWKDSDYAQHTATAVPAHSRDNRMGQVYEPISQTCKQRP